MKKIAAILLLCILLVNTVGYRFILGYMEEKANTQMIARLDNNEYSQDELVEISAPLNLPYFTNWQHFERCDGQVTINGTVYNYVARKYVNNVMTYKCIVNKTQQRVINVKKQADNIAFGDAEAGKQKKNESALSSYFKHLTDYDNHCGNSQQHFFSLLPKYRYLPYSASLYFTQKEAPHRPPPMA